MRKFFLNLGAGCVSALLPFLICILICSSFIISPEYFLLFNEKQDIRFEDSLKMNTDDVEAALDRMFGYVVGKYESPQIRVSIMNEKTEFLNSREMVHLADIKVFYQSCKCIVMLLLLICIFIYLFLGVYKKEYQFIAKMYLYGQAGGLLIIVAAIAVFMVEPVFFITKFHNLFFQGNSWIFNPATDRIIHFFPNALYMKILLDVGIVYLGIGTVFGILSCRILRSKRIYKSKYVNRTVSQRRSK